MTDISNTFDDVIKSAISRRKVLFGGGAAAAALFLSPQLAGTVSAKGGSSPIAGQPVSPSGLPGIMDFTEVGKTTADVVTVPKGYIADVLYSWGDSITGTGNKFKGAAIALDEQLVAAGNSHDGMHFFPLPSHGPNQRGLLVINHEITETEFLFADQENSWNQEKSLKSMAAQGISVVEVKRTGNKWKVVPSPFARRITTMTPMLLTGPAAGDGLLVTSADTTGTRVFGTANNCANGHTPWGTYLTCEENFDAYFGIKGNDTRSPEQKTLHGTYGLGLDDFGPPLYLTESRFDIALEPNEPNRFGWVVEIDPLDPTSTPKKRTALGRMKHENAEVVTDGAGYVIVYTGDDERGQYLYKFVSELTITEAEAAGESPLDAGTLHVARFDNAEASGDYAGVGTWIPLTPETTPFEDPSTMPLQGWSSAKILINARRAATLVGATKMDRPEWVAADPTNPGTVYCTLTNSNSSNRPAISVNDANPRTANPNGHIIRWVEAGGDPKATSFTFDIFLLAGDLDNLAQSAPDDTAAVTPRIPAFTDPDGLWFDGAGNLFIQTDGGQPEGLNNQMLVASTEGSHVTGVTIKRFLVGPVGCEVTGIAQSPDGTALFVNIQHPGEGMFAPMNPDPPSDWPDKVGGLPRSSTIVIRREDGGPVSAPRS